MAHADNRAMKMELRDADEINKRHERLTARYTTARLAKEAAERQVQMIKTLQKVLREEEAAYQDRAKKGLEASVDSYIPIVFPDQPYKAKLECDFKWGSLKAYLRLLDEDDHLRLPHISEGGMLQSVIGLSTLLAALKKLGIYRLFLDEAFAPSSNANLEKVCEILKAAIDEGFQIIMIDQRPDAFISIPRREFRWVRNPITKKVESEVVDLGEDEEYVGSKVI